jgi:acyl carrier protein
MGIVDSLGMRQLVEVCEARHGIRLEDSDLVIESFDSVRGLGAWVHAKPCEATASGDAKPSLGNR